MSSAQLPMQMSDVNDPLRAHIPPNETPEERKRRTAAEKKARKISEAIDKQLKAEKEEMEKARGTKLLLLGSLSIFLFLFLFYVWFDFTLCWNIDMQMLCSNSSLMIMQCLVI